MDVQDTPKTSSKIGTSFSLSNIQSKANTSARDENLTELRIIDYFKRSRPAFQSSVSVYAAQCDNCRKWRVVSSQEEFEEIRSKLNEEPFTCSRKPQVTCDDLADIEYDATRTWVIDKPNLPKTPTGFKRSLVLRRDYSKIDVYYITPLGKKVRTRNEVAAFLKANPDYEGTVSPEEFSFTVPKIMEDTIPDDIVPKKSSASASTKKKLKTMQTEDQE